MEKKIQYAHTIANSIVEDLYYRDDFKDIDPVQQLHVLELVRDKLLQVIIGEVDNPCNCFKCTKRDKLAQILEFSRKGMTNVAIAKEMKIGEKTVRRLISSQ